MGSLDRSAGKKVLLSAGMSKLNIFAAVAASLGNVAHTASDKVLSLFGGSDVPNAKSLFCPRVSITGNIQQPSTGWCKENKQMLKRSKAKRAAHKARVGY